MKRFTSKSSLPEDEVHPQVQVRAHCLALQRVPVQPHKLTRAPARPRGQGHVAYRLAILPAAEGERVAVDQHLGQVEELWDELLERGRKRVRERSTAEAHFLTESEDNTKPLLLNPNPP